MRHTRLTNNLLTLAAICGFTLAGCDQQQPIAVAPRPDPGIKPGETPPVELDQGPNRNSDGTVPVPPATAPATPGEQNNPSAPIPFAPPPTAPSTNDATPVLPPPNP